MGTNETVVAAALEEDRRAEGVAAKQEAVTEIPGGDEPTAPPGQPVPPDGKYDG